MSDSPPSRRRSRAIQRHRTRIALVSSATKLFAEQGYTPVSIDHIAEHAGYTRGAVYGQFGSKAALADAVLNRVYGYAITRTTRQLAAMRAATRRTDFEAFIGLITDWVEAAVRDPAWVRLELELAAERGHWRPEQAGRTESTSDRSERLPCLKTLAIQLISNRYYVGGGP